MRCSPTRRARAPRRRDRRELERVRHLEERAAAVRTRVGEVREGLERLPTRARGRRESAVTPRPMPRVARRARPRGVSPRRDRVQQPAPRRRARSRAQGGARRPRRRSRTRSRGEARRRAGGGVRADEAKLHEEVEELARAAEKVAVDLRHLGGSRTAPAGDPGTTLEELDDWAARCGRRCSSPGHARVGAGADRRRGERPRCLRPRRAARGIRASPSSDAGSRRASGVSTGSSDRGARRSSAPPSRQLAGRAYAARITFRSASRWSYAVRRTRRAVPSARPRRTARGPASWSARHSVTPSRRSPPRWTASCASTTNASAACSRPRRSPRKARS